MEAMPYCWPTPECLPRCPAVDCATSRAASYPAWGHHWGSWLRQAWVPGHFLCACCGQSAMQWRWGVVTATLQPPLLPPYRVCGLDRWEAVLLAPGSAQRPCQPILLQCRLAPPGHSPPL